jgi:hypothetical protein
MNISSAIAEGLPPKIKVKLVDFLFFADIAVRIKKHRQKAFHKHLWITIPGFLSRFYPE